MLFRSLKPLFDKLPCLRQLCDILHPYKDVIVFMVTLLVSNQVWKWMIHGDETGVGDVTWCGLVVTPIFDALALNITDVVYALCSLLSDGVYRAGDTLLRFADGHGTRIVWSCTPLKQCFIWMCLIATVLNADGSKRATNAKLVLHKLWYIPVGWIAVYGINILRIAAITLLIEHHPEWFELLHTYIFKYLFYGLMFLGWVLFVEKIRPNEKYN